MAKYKYTDDDLIEAVKISISYTDVLRKLNAKALSGGIWRHIKTRITNLKIDTSHFIGHKPMLGRRPSNKKTTNEILNDNWHRKPNTLVLRNALFEIGIEHKCNECDIDNTWNNKKLVLQIDHIDGNVLNNKSENLQFLCPNCHSQTSNFGIKNSPIYKNRKVKKCLDCLVEISKKGIRCRDCAATKRTYKNTKINWPTNNDLIKQLKESNYSLLAKKLGVSDNAIRKRLKKK